jgi:hypothetical protein
MLGLNESTISLLILCAIPILGAIKNIVKRKSFKVTIFLRSFVIYGVLCALLYSCFGFTFKLNLFESMILSLSERWGMFVYKIGYSVITKNYEKKKYKYYEKYNMDLSSNSLEKFVSNESNSKENKK